MNADCKAASPVPGYAASKSRPHTNSLTLNTHNTMDTQLHQLLLQRHSIRRYTDQPISAEDVKTILEAALLAPSSKSLRPWQFVVVEDHATLEALAQCKDFGAKPIAGASMAVAVTVDPAKSECWLEDSSVAAIFMHLQAAALGIGSCWIQVMGRYKGEESAEDIVRTVLEIPDSQKVVCIVTFGYSDEVRKPVDPDKLLWEKVHIGKWRPDSDE